MITKYILVVLVVTTKVDYFVVPEFAFNTYKECLNFAMTSNSIQKPKSPYVYMCTDKNKGV
jgi:hypothetical protein